MSIAWFSALSAESSLATRSPVLKPSFPIANATALDGFSNFIFNDLLQNTALSSNKDPRVKDYFRKLPSNKKKFFSRFPKDVDSYNDLILVHAYKGLANQGFIVYQDMKKDGIIPNIATYTALIRLCGTKYRRPLFDHSKNRFTKDVERAFYYMEEIRNRGFSPRLVDYHTLIATCVNLEHVDRAFDVLDMMRKDKLTPDLKIYTSLIRGCIKSNQLERAKETYRIMVVSGTDPDSILYNTMISYCAKAGNVEEAISFFNEMEMRQCIPSLVTFNTLMHACARRKDFTKEAFEYYDMAIVQGHVPDKYTFGALLQACNLSHDLATAQILWNQMDEFGVSKNSVHYSTFIHTISKTQTQQVIKIGEAVKLTQNQRIQVAEHMFKNMLQISKKKPTIHTLNCLLNVYTRALRKFRAEEFMKKRFTYYGFKPNFYSYLAMLRMYCKIRMLEKSLEVLTQMKKARIQPDKLAYQYLLKLCKWRKAVDQGVQLVAEAKAAGINLDPYYTFPFIDHNKMHEKKIVVTEDGFGGVEVKNPKTGKIEWFGFGDYNEDKFSPFNPSWQIHMQNIGKEPFDKIKEKPLRRKERPIAYSIPLLNE